MASTPKVASYVGMAKETVPGTGVAAATFFPATLMAPKDIPNYVPDEGIRGSNVDSYDQIQTQGWSTYGLEGAVYVDSLGLLLKSLFGEEAAAGSAPTTHTFTLLNTGSQPPTLSVTDFNGVNSRQFVYSLCASLTLNFSADGLINYHADMMGLRSATVSNPTKSFSTVAAKPGHLGTVTIGSTSTLLQSGSVTIARSVNPILAINNSASPSEIFGGALGITGTLVTIYQADALVVTPFQNATPTTLNFSWSSGSGATAFGLNFVATAALFTENDTDRGDDYVKMSTNFFAKPNTTDVGVSGGYGPGKIVLTNQQSAAY